MKSSDLSYKLISQEDVSFIHELYSDWKISKYLNKIPFPFELGDAIKLVGKFEEMNKNSRNRNLVVYSSGDFRKCGVCVLNEASKNRAILGFSILPKYQKRGIATQAARDLIREAEREGFAEVQASPIKNNEASIKVLRKLGFEIEQDFLEEESIHSGVRLASRWVKHLTRDKTV